MKKKEKADEKQFHIQIAVIFTIILLVLLFLTLIFKKLDFSEKEGRELAKAPQISVDRLVEKTAQMDTENYLADHFAFRDFFTGITQFAERLAGASERNGIYKGKSGYLLEQFKGTTEEDRKEKTDAINAFAEEFPDLDMYVLIAPTADNILSEKLPSGAPETDQTAFLDAVKEDLDTSISFIDVSKTLRNHKEEQLYYKSDSKWTSLGAYYAYREAGQVMSMDMSGNNFEALPVSESFRGDLAMASGFSCETDSINCYFPQDSSYTEVVEYVNEGIKTASPYSSAALDSNYKYDVFYGGDYGLLHINSSALGKERLLIIKDSWANCFIPFFTSSYREIYVVDPRYYYGDLKKLMADENIKDVLFVYGANSFAQDTSLVSVLKEE